LTLSWSVGREVAGGAIEQEVDVTVIGGPSPPSHRVARDLRAFNDSDLIPLLSLGRHRSYSAARLHLHVRAASF
jgi:hypothetical protein